MDISGRVAVSAAASVSKVMVGTAGLPAVGLD
jgi:hypothetical protein